MPKDDRNRNGRVIPPQIVNLLVFGYFLPFGVYLFCHFYSDRLWAWDIFYSICKGESKYGAKLLIL